MNGCCYNPVLMELIGVVTSDPPVEPALFMRFDSTLSMPVADPANVDDWNTFFGQPFTSVVQDGNDIYLYGGVDIVMSGGLAANTGLIQVIDYALCVVDVFPGAFTDCSSLTTCILNAALAIGASAHTGNAQLTTVQYNSAITVGDFAFQDCPLTLDASFDSLETVGEGSFKSSGIIASNFDNVTSIGISAFEATNFFTNPSFPSCITAGANAFVTSGCVTASFPLLVDVPDEMFANCASLTTANLPVMETAGEGAFNFAGLSAVEFDTLVTAGDFCFRDCAATIVDLPILETAGVECFALMLNVVTINLPAVTAIGLGGLAENPVLETLNIPMVTDIAGAIYLDPSIISMDLNSMVLFDGTVQPQPAIEFINMPECTDELFGDYVFSGVTGQVITVNVNIALQTSNGGNPAAWIVTMLADNPGSTVNYIP